jgi:hypothetical protein
MNSIKPICLSASFWFWLDVELKAKQVSSFSSLKENECYFDIDITGTVLTERIQNF